MKNTTKTLIASAVALTLIGCGGGGGSSDGGAAPAKKTVEGKVIDGYISGATVFLDLNFNSKLDAGEPSTVTGEAGAFALTVTDEQAECSQYVPTVTHVPVGAIDSDYPNQPITEAYTMVSPPSFAMSTDEDLLNLTPLTSVVWTSVEKELYGNSEVQMAALTCESIIEDQATRETIADRLEEQEIRTAQRYNITIDEMYGDYVAKAQTEVHTLAQSIVPGLQASYADTLVLEDTYPTAEYVFVEYYMEVNNEVAVQTYDYSSSEWFRREFVQLKSGNWTEVTNSMSQDLETVGAVYGRASQATRDNGVIQYEENIMFAADSTWTSYAPSYDCNVQENYWESDRAIQKGVSNNAFVGGMTDWADCESLDRVLNNSSQSHLTRTHHEGQTDLPFTESNHWYGENNPNVIADLIGINPDSISQGWLSQHLNFIQTAFRNEDAYGADQWFRVEYTYSDLVNFAGTQTVRMHDNEDNYSILTNNANGTHSKQCGTWSANGSDLVDCTK